MTTPALTPDAFMAQQGGELTPDSFMQSKGSLTPDSFMDSQIKGAIASVPRPKIPVEPLAPLSEASPVDIALGDWPQTTVAERPSAVGYKAPPLTAGRVAGMAGNVLTAPQPGAETAMPQLGTQAAQGVQELGTPGKRAGGALKLAEAGTEALTPLIGPAIAENPFNLAKGFLTGTVAGKGAGYVAKKAGATPEQQALAENLGFWAPAVAGAVLKPSVNVASTPEATAATGTAFGGRAGAGIAVTPEAVTVKGKVGPFEGSKTFQRGSAAKPAIEPQTIEGEPLTRDQVAEYLDKAKWNPDAAREMAAKEKAKVPVAGATGSEPAAAVAQNPVAAAPKAKPARAKPEPVRTTDVQAPPPEKAATNVERGTATAPQANNNKDTAEPKYKFRSTQANIPADSEAHQALETARARISDSDLAGDGKDVGGEVGNHVTVRYGMQGDDTEALKKYISSLAPFEAKLGKTQQFEPNEHTEGAAVIQAPVVAPELHEINSKVGDHADFKESDFSEYRPHVTLAYVKPERAARYVGMSLTEGKTFKINSIGITDKNGNVEEVPLRGTGAQESSASSPALQTVPDRNAADTKQIADLVVSPAFKEKGLGGLDVPTQRAVMGSVISALHDPEIRKVVMRAVPINVVDTLAGFKSTAKVALHDKNVLSDLLSGNLKNSVSVRLDTADALVRAVASATAKSPSGTAKVGSNAPNAGAALSAGNEGSGLTSTSGHGRNLASSEASRKGENVRKPGEAQGAGVQGRPGENLARPEVAQGAGAPGEVDRRQDIEQRKRVAEMSPAEMQQELLRSHVVDLPNRRAFDEQGKSGAVAMSDADGLKAVNEKFGYEAGNALLKAKADALKDAGLDSYHDKGDEFVHRGSSAEELSSKLETARGLLRNRVIEFRDLETGQLRRFQGADFSHGSGSKLSEAETALKEHKGAREAAGERARGELRSIAEVGPQEAQVRSSAAKEVAPPAQKSKAQIERERIEATKEGVKSPPTQRTNIPLDQQLRTAVSDGEMRLRSGVNSLGEKLKPAELETIRKSVDKAKRDLKVLDKPAVPTPSQPVTKVEQATSDLLKSEAGSFVPGKIGEAVKDVGSAVRQYVSDAADFTKVARDTQRGLETLDSQRQADILRAKNLMESVKLPKADDESLYHHLEDPDNISLSPAQEKTLNDVILPLQEQNTALYQEATQGGMPLENYVHRVVKGKGSMLDRIAQGIRAVGTKATLSKSAPATKQRTYMALENQGGDRKIVSIKGGQVTEWDRGTPVNLGGLSTTQEGKVFEDANGDIWNLKQATTKEIEGSTDTRYYHSALASTVASNVQLRAAVRAQRFLNEFKNSPEFQEIAVEQAKVGNAPKGWKTTDLPQFKGYYFEPRTAEVLDWFYDRLRNGDANAYDKIGNLMRVAMLLNPIMHPMNVAASWAVEKGATGFLPTNYFNIARTGGKAIKAVWEKNQDYIDALDAGGALMSSREATKDLTKLFFDQLSDGLGKEEPWAVKMAKSLGMEKGNLLNAVHQFASKAAWLSNDIFVLQSAYEHMGAGMTMKDALKESGRIIPEYRIPTRILDSPAISKLMRNKWATIFGAYHYGLLKSFGEIAKSAVGAQEPPPGGTKAGEVGKGWDRIALLGIVALALYPALDQLAKTMTGDKHAKVKRSGPFGLLDALAETVQGKQSVGQAVQRVVMPAPQTKSAAEMLYNRQFYSGRQIYDPHSDFKTQGWQIGRYLLNEFGQIGQAERAFETTEGKRRFILQQLGIVQAHTKAEKIAQDIAAGKWGSQAADPTKHEKSVLKREILDQLRKGNDQPLRGALEKKQLTPNDAHTLRKRGRETPLQDLINSNEFSYPETARVYEAADEGEKKQIRPILTAKRNRLLEAGRGAEAQPVQ